ncbi:L-asparaginase 2 [soil metagenome]
MTELPGIVILATGGTIAGRAATATDATGYRAGATGVDDLIASLPQLAGLARLSGEQWSQLDSSDVTDELLIALATRVDELQSDPAVDGIVITHGTDTLEESAYFLHLVLASDKPVVLVGALRPATALSADGPRNLYAAVVTAASRASVGQGVLVVMNDEIHSARDVTKTSTTNVAAFASPYGPLGVVIDDAPRYYRGVSRPHTAATEFALPARLPTSAIVVAHPGLTDVPRAELIVFAGFGNGTIPARLVDPLLESNAVVVRASRVGAGALSLIGASDARVTAWPVVDDQSPQRARLLVALALTVTRDPTELQRILHTY